MPKANQRSLSLNQMLAREDTLSQQGDSLDQSGTFMMHTHTDFVDVRPTAVCLAILTNTHKHTA